jgi:hypothetical protein
MIYRFLIASAFRHVASSIPSLAIIGSTMHFRAAVFNARMRTAPVAKLVSCQASSSAASREHTAIKPPTIAILPSTPVIDAIRQASVALGRSPSATEDELARLLEKNWYETAGDLATISDTQATALGMPLRLRSAIMDALENDCANDNHVALVSDSAETSTADDHGADDNLVDLLEAGNDGDGLEHLQWIPIEERVCPPLQRFGHDPGMLPQVTSRTKAAKYALDSSEMTPALQEEFAALFRFGTQAFFGAQQDVICGVTAEKYSDHLRAALGWLHRERTVPLEKLSLRALLPSSKREGVALTFEYVQWLIRERSIAVSTQLIVLRSFMHCAKFLYHNESRIVRGSGDKPYSDLPVVKELRALINAANKSAKVAPRVADETLKWLDWPEYLKVVEELRKECAGLRSLGGKKRTRSAVARSVQRYLMFAILASVPDRQRTLRELEVGRTLVKVDGRWVIKHGPEEYKTGRVYGTRPLLVLPQNLVPYLDDFITTWRQELNPQHKFLFSQVGGKPLTDKGTWKVFMKTAYRLSGKRCHPHLVRDMIVTYLRNGNATERELEALALLMGHSVDMQRSSYDRRSKEQKIEPAMTLLETLNTLGSQ